MFRIGFENCGIRLVMEQVEFKTVLERDKILEKWIVL